MREQIKENDYAFNKIYNQLEKTDFTNFICSPLVNGGCGLGKTTALTDDRTYDLFKKKLGKPSPQILVIESRSMTRDQLKEKNTNPNYHFYQFDRASTLELEQYDIVIIDEAHSLFSDAEFAPRATAPLASWLRKSLCFQIYITASDEEFLSFANKYFENKEFELTFPDLNEVHVRYTAKEMFFSINKEKVEKVIKRKEKHFFEEKKKGLFFILAAKDVVSLYNYYTNLGYKCGFYVSQHNSTQIIVKEDITENDPEDLEEYGSRTITLDVLDYYNLLEKQRAVLGLPTLRESLLKGRFPEDVDFLFMTSAGQEGISLYDEHLDFIFIEDTYPLTINQKLFRYRNNVEEAYIHLPQKRIEQALQRTLEKVQELMHAPQEYLKGYYEGAGGKNRKGIARIVWFDEEDQKYKVAENYLAYIITKSQAYRMIRENKNNEEWLRDTYGQYADAFHLIDSAEDRRKDILENFMRDKNGVLLTEQIKKEWLKQLKKEGFVNLKQNKDFSFDFVIQQCRFFKVCSFKRHKASKADCLKNSSLKYRKEYLLVVVPGVFK